MAIMTLDAKTLEERRGNLFWSSLIVVLHLETAPVKVRVTAKRALVKRTEARKDAIGSKSVEDVQAE